MILYTGRGGGIGESEKAVQVCSRNYCGIILYRIYLYIYMCIKICFHGNHGRNNEAA